MEVPESEPSDEHFETRVRESFARQGAMALIGAALDRVAPGRIDIVLPFRSDLTQQTTRISARRRCHGHR
jgi:acyl-coenzyme A thioesterase PaaI-like protein